MKPDESTLRQFGISGDITFLPGGESRTYRVRDVVLKHLNNDSIQYTTWIADIFDGINAKGFRVSKPLRSRMGTWVTSDGWTAWTFLEGNHYFRGHIVESIQAINAFHEAIKRVPRPDFLRTDDSAYTRADRYAWAERPDDVHLELKGLVDSLYDVREQVQTSAAQLIHGDLNPDNLLLAPGLPPAIIDIAPYWRPPEFALAIYAYWIACYRDDPGLLKHFSNVPEFTQMLIRAGIRMLLIMSEFNSVHELDKYIRATNIILGYLNSPSS